MNPDLEVSREIAATPAAVFAALTDITRMGEWSPETIRAEWHEGFTGPALGASFVGHNKYGENEWSTDAEIVEFVENERFVFKCTFDGFHFASWGYRIEPTDQGCTVTEMWWDVRPEEVKAVSSSISGVGDRVPHNRQGMADTLERLAAGVE